MNISSGGPPVNPTAPGKRPLETETQGKFKEPKLDQPLSGGVASNSVGKVSDSQVISAQQGQLISPGETVEISKDTIERLKEISDYFQRIHGCGDKGMNGLSWNGQNYTFCGISDVCESLIFIQKHMENWRELTTFQAIAFIKCMLKFLPTDELQKELSKYLSENLLEVIHYLKTALKMTGEENKEIKSMIQEIGEHDEIANATLLNIDFSKIPDSGPARLETIRDLGELFLKSLEAITLKSSQKLTQDDLEALVFGIDNPIIPITLQDEYQGDDGSLVKIEYKGSNRTLTLDSNGKVKECRSLSLVKSDESVVNVTGKDHMRVKIDPESGTLLQWVTLSAKSIELVGNPCQRKIEDKETIALDYRYENCWFTGNLSLDTDINVHTGTFKVATTPKKYENLNVEYNRGSVFSSAAFIGIRAIDDNGRFWQCITHHNCGRYENCFYYGTTDAPVTFVRQVAPTSNEHFFRLKAVQNKK